jgi:hypothetical protein
MKRHLYTLALLLTLSAAQAQTPDLLLNWAKALNNTQAYGGSLQGNGIAVDASGNVYITGNFQGTADFDPGVGIANLTSSAGSYDIFLAKYDASGNYVYAKSIGGLYDDYGYSVAVDISGNAFIAGSFTGTPDFDPGAGTANLTSAGGNDIFFAKYDASGNYVYAKAMGGTRSDAGNAIVVDASGNVYITGSFQATVDFDPGAGVVSFTELSAGVGDIFLAKYDASGNYVYAKQMGGAAGADVGNAIAIDGSGNAYITGSFNGTVDFDPGAGTANLTSAGGNDIFFAKYDASGNYVYAKRMGGTNSDIGNSIAIDGSGNAYITGSFNGTADFDPGAGTQNLVSAGGSDIFLAKYDASGNYAYAKSIGGTSLDVGSSISIDGTGTAYITGYFIGTVDFDPGVGTQNLTSSAGSYDIFLAKYDASGNYVYAKCIGGTSSDIGNSIAIDGTGNAYITGYFIGTVDFDPGAGTANLTAGNTFFNAFAAKYDASGNYLWAGALGGYGNTTYDDRGQSAAIDNSGNVYITGRFTGTVDFDPGAGTANLTSAGNTDIFIAKYDALGNYVYAKRMGDVNSQEGRSITVDASGNAYVTGNFSGSVDFDPGNGTVNLTTTGGLDIFFAKYDASGNYVYAKGMGSTFGPDYGEDITVDASGNVYITGSFYGIVDFDPGAGTVNLTSAGGNDIFLAKYDALGNYVYANRMGGSSEDGCSGIALDGSNNAYITGNFQSTADFDPGAGTANLTSAGASDIFLAKYDASGNYLYAKRMGGTNSDVSNSIAIDASGNAHITGYHNGTADFDPGAGTVNLTTFAGHYNIFLAKYDASGNYVYAKSMGGTSNESYGYSIATDASGNAYITGNFQGTTDFDPGAGTANLVSAGGVDIFLARYDASGNYVYAKRMGSTANDYGNSVATDGSGNAYITGLFQGTADFDPSAGTTNLISTNNFDVFIARYSEDGVIYTGTFTGSPFCSGASVSVPFTALGTFTAGNVFTAQLSDATGSFASPTAIGTLAATASGTINATIPAMPGGTGYRIRVVSSTPVINGYNNGTDIALYPVVTPSVSIAITTGTNPTCNGTNPTFTATPVNGGAAPTYNWLVNGSSVQNGPSATFTATFATGDVISCELTNNEPCVVTNTATSNSITLTVIGDVTALGLTGPTILCNSASPAVYTVNSDPDATAYNWSISPVAAGTLAAAANSVTVTWATGYSGMATVSVNASNTCFTSTTSNINLALLPWQQSTGFTESMGTVASSTTVTAHETANGFDNDALTMAASSTTVAVNNTTPSSGYAGASGGAYVQIPSNSSNRRFTISGINTTSMSNIVLRFGNSGFSPTVEYSTDGSTFTALAKTSATGSGWREIAVVSGIPQTANLYLRFTGAGFFGSTAFLDDIRLTYNNNTTAPVITAGGTTNLCGGGSVTLNSGAAYIGYLWNTGQTTSGITVNTAGSFSMQAVGIYGCPSAASNTISTTLISTPVWYLDADNDNYYTGTGVTQCSSPGAGYKNTGLIAGGDCNDANAAINPGATEITCNAVDENCNGMADDDAVAPVITLPANIVTTAASGSCTKVVTYTTPTATDNCNTVNLGTATFYLRSNIGEPWGNGSNVTAMNVVFGSGAWSAAFFETANAAAIFSNSTRFVFMDGSDGGANAFNTFITNNITLIQNWVNSGGSLLLNSAPNQGGNINLGFGGTTIIYSYPTSRCGSVTAVNGAHPIFTSPIPVGSGPFTGNDFSHSYINGTGLTNLIQGCTFFQLSYKQWGAGNVAFGAMTTPNFHSPQPNAQNLRQNILSWLNSLVPTTLSVNVTQTAGLPSGSAFPVGTTTNTFQSTDANGNVSTSSFTVTVNTTDIWYLDADNDGYYIATQTACTSPGPGWNTSATVSGDCNDNNNLLTTVCGYSWTGATSQAWGLGSNWSTGTPPTATDDVTIPDVANDPVISTAVTINDISLAAGATLTVANNGVLTLNGNLNNSGAITIQHGGNFLQGGSSSYGGSGTFTVEKNSIKRSLRLSRYCLTGKHYGS